MIEIRVPAESDVLTTHSLYLSGMRAKQMYSPAQEVVEWFEQNNIPCRYEPLWSTPPGGPSRSPTFYGVRFKFEQDHQALLFKLTWGGV
jgi:hypothetical protein